MSKLNTSVRFPPHCHTASAAYDYLMKTRAYLNAAQVAFENGLGEKLLHAAALPAISQLLALQEFEAAWNIVQRYKLVIDPAGDRDYLDDLVERGEIPAWTVKSFFVNGPATLQ